MDDTLETAVDEAIEEADRQCRIFKIKGRSRNAKQIIARHAYALLKQRIAAAVAEAKGREGLTWGCLEEVKLALIAVGEDMSETPPMMYSNAVVAAVQRCSRAAVDEAWKEARRVVVHMGESLEDVYADAPSVATQMVVAMEPSHGRAGLSGPGEILLKPQEPTETPQPTEKTHDRDHHELRDGGRRP